MVNGVRRGGFDIAAGFPLNINFEMRDGQQHSKPVQLHWVIIETTSPGGRGVPY